jgi:hypothetical protein
MLFYSSQEKNNSLTELYYYGLDRTISELFGSSEYSTNSAIYLLVIGKGHGNWRWEFEEGISVGV